MCSVLSELFWGYTEYLTLVCPDVYSLRRIVRLGQLIFLEILAILHFL